MRFPRNVALVRVTLNGRNYVVVNPKLTHDQELAARVTAAVLGASQPYVLLTCTDVMAAMHAAAAA